MSVCVETSAASAQIQPSVVSSTSEPIVSASSPARVEVGNINEQKLEQHGGTVAKLVMSSQHGPAGGGAVLQKMVNSPLITVINSTGPVTVVKSICVTSVVSGSPQYTIGNSSASLNPIANATGKSSTITVLNCGPLASPVTLVKTISAQQAIEKSSPTVDNLPTVSNNSQNAAAVSPVIENRGHNVFVKNTCLETQTIADNVPQSHKLLTAANFSHNNVVTNINTVNKPPGTVNGQRSKLKILGNVQISHPNQHNITINKNINIPQQRFNTAAGGNRPKMFSVNNTVTKYMAKSPNNVLKSSLNDKSPKIMQKVPIKSLPPSTFIPKQPHGGIKTLSPQHQHKNIPGQIQRTGSGLRTIPPQRPPLKLPATKANYIGKHAVQAQKIKPPIHSKMRSSRPAGTYGGYHQPEKPLTFNQVLTAQIIETLSSNSSPSTSLSANNRYEMMQAARYDSAFTCPDKLRIAEQPKVEEKGGKSGLDALSLICQAVLLDHNYNATLPTESAPRPTPPIITQAQQQQVMNGMSPSYGTLPNKRKVPVPSVSIQTGHSSNMSVPCQPNNGGSILANQINRDDDAASDISDISDRKHDTEGEETDTAPEAEDLKSDEHYGDYVTRCICGFLHDDGYMVECDRCKVWQHVQCVVKNRQIPDEYLCEMCDHSKTVDRQKARLLQQQWLKDRQLIEPRIRKEAKLKDTLRDHNMSDTDSCDEIEDRTQLVPNKSRMPSTSARRKSDQGPKVNNKKDVKEVQHRRQKRKEKRIIKRRAKIQTKQQLQSHSDDENQDTWSAHLPQLRQWIEKYEDAVTNHYSPELRARISSIRVNGAQLDSNTVSYDSTVCNCRIHTQPLTEIKYLVSTAQLDSGTPVIELRGKYMLSTQHRNSGGSLATRQQHAQRPGPFLFFYRLQKDNTEVCVDTRTYGNSARFIRRSCKPNAELRHCIEKGVLHLYIVTTTSVDKNSELTIKHESHDLAAVGTTQIACACGRSDDCAVNQSTSSVKKNGESSCEFVRKRRGRRTISAGLSSPSSKPISLKEHPANQDNESAVDLPPSVLPHEPKVKDAKEEDIKDEVLEASIKVEIKEEIPEHEENSEVQPLEEIKKEEESVSSMECSTPIKCEVKEENAVKEEKEESPPSTPVSTRRSSQYKSDKDDSSKSGDSKEQLLSTKRKLSREERKLEAILRAIEQMEKADQKKQEHQAKQAHRRESEPSSNSKDEEKSEPKVKRRRRRGRARTTSTNAQTRRNRLNSTDSYLTSGDENLLSPNDSLVLHKPGKETAAAADMLLALSNGESEFSKNKKTSIIQESDLSPNSSPEVPQLSSACLLVQAAVEPLERQGFKFPKTKKGLMNEWLHNKVPGPMQTASSISNAAIKSNFVHHSEDESLGSQNHKNLATSLANSANFCDVPSAQQRGGNAKKRWLRQAISEDHSCDSPLGRSDSPPLPDAAAPPKKRKLPRESMSNGNSPPGTPSSVAPPKFIDTPRSSQDGSVEMNQYNQSDTSGSPFHMETDMDNPPVNSNKHTEFGDYTTNLLDPRLSRESTIFTTNSEQLVGTVERTLSFLGMENSLSMSDMSTPTKRKVKLSITEYRQRKRLHTDKTLDEQEMDNVDLQPGTVDDNNSSESFRNEMLPKSRSRSSSSGSSSISSTEMTVKVPAFNSEPTELERQREISNMRLKKAFGIPINSEPRTSIDVTSILTCDTDPVVKQSTASPLARSFTTYSELSLSPTLRTMGAPGISPSPLLVQEEEAPNDDHKTQECPVKEVQSIDAEPVVDSDKNNMQMFYTPDEEEEERSTSLFVENDNISYVPPFNNPVYPNSSFTSTIDDDSRYQSRNPSPPPDLDPTTSFT